MNSDSVYQKQIHFAKADRPELISPEQSEGSFQKSLISKYPIRKLKKNSQLNRLTL